MIPIDQYPDDSAELAVARYLEGWAQRNWQSMLEHVQPSWKAGWHTRAADALVNRSYTAFGAIRRQNEGRVLDRYEIRGVQTIYDDETLEQCQALGVDSALLCDVQVLITWHPRGVYPISRLEQAILVRCLRQGTDHTLTYGLSEDAPWRVNPPSVFRVVDPSTVIEPAHETHV